MTAAGVTTSGRTVGTMLVLLLASAVALAGDKLPTARHLAAPQYVTANTRAQLRARMGRHGEVMSNLLRAVVLLERPTVRVLANRIADEEVIAYNDRSAADRLNLPPECLAQQTVLATGARQLAAAAANLSDDQGLARCFANLTTTCVGCHSAYLHGRPEPQQRSK